MSWESRRPKRIGVAHFDSTGHARTTARTLHPEETAERSTDQYGVYGIRVVEGDRTELYVQYESVWVGQPFTDKEGLRYPGRYNIGISVVASDCDLEPYIWLPAVHFASWRLFEAVANG